jgi:hypothetical protein
LPLGWEEFQRMPYRHIDRLRKLMEKQEADEKAAVKK